MVTTLDPGVVGDRWKLPSFCTPRLCTLASLDKRPASTTVDCMAPQFHTFAELGGITASTCPARIGTIDCPSPTWRRLSDDLLHRQQYRRWYWTSRKRRTRRHRVLRWACEDVNQTDRQRGPTNSKQNGFAFWITARSAHGVAAATTPAGTAAPLVPFHVPVAMYPAGPICGNPAGALPAPP